MSFSSGIGKTVGQKSVKKNVVFFSCISVIILWSVQFSVELQEIFIDWLEFSGFPYAILALLFSIGIAFLNHSNLLRAGASISPLGLLFLFITCSAVGISHVADLMFFKKMFIIMLVPAIIWALCGRFFFQVLAYPSLIFLFTIPFFKYYNESVYSVFLNWLLYATSFISSNLFWDADTLVINNNTLTVTKELFCVKYFFFSLFVTSVFSYFANIRVFSGIIRMFVFGVGLLLITILLICAFAVLDLFLNFNVFGGIKFFLFQPYFSLLILFGLNFLMLMKFKGNSRISNRIPIFMHSSNRDSFSSIRWVAPTFISLCMVYVIPWFSHNLPDVPWQEKEDYAFHFPKNGKKWEGPYKTNVSEWNLELEGADKLAIGKYSQNKEKVIVFAGYSSYFKDKTPNLSSDTNLFNKKVWSIVKRDIKQYKLEKNNKKIKIIETVLQSNNKKRIVWQWYQIGDLNLINTSSIKFLESLRIISKLNKPSGVIAVATDFDYDAQQARELLKGFINEVNPRKLLS